MSKFKIIGGLAAVTVVFFVSRYFYQQSKFKSQDSLKASDIKPAGGQPPIPYA